MGNLAAHHTGIALHGKDLRNAAARIDAVICVIALLIILVQILLRGMEGIRILHRKLTHADKTAPCARLIPELGLYLVDHEGIIGV